MKKLICMILFTIMIFTLSVSVSAANGDVAGKIYATDIRAFINGIEVQSYNIGGKTAVILEDILMANARQCTYDDSARTLTFYSLDPSYLVENKTQSMKTPGTVIGSFYQTDIKISIYDVAIPTVIINGKAAAAIEDLGSNGAFSSIGGKFIWNEKERTISLEFLYQNWSEVSNDRRMTVHFNDSMTEAAASFEETFHCGGGQNFYYPKSVLTGESRFDAVIPIKANNEVIGYHFRKILKNDTYAAFFCFYHEKVAEAEKVYTPASYKSREEIIRHFTNNHSVGEPVARFDTENYSFIYISVAGTSWTSYNLVQAYDDGTYIDYGKIINTRNRAPSNLVINEETETVRFKYVDRYTPEWFTNYEIDLNQGEIRVRNTFTTDIGVGSADGQPLSGEQTAARNAQYEYVLFSGNEEKTVNGFSSQEYYYADMLPLAETFDFFNIQYTFENDILTIDTTQARPFSYRMTETPTDALGQKPIDHLLVEKVFVNGEETQITYPFTSGHFDNATDSHAEAKPYVCSGIVYINASFIRSLCE